MTESGFAVWLYGSVARGDADEWSDTDVLVVGPGNDVDRIDLGAYASASRLSVSRYTWSEMAAMAEYGSLFLHHLASEAYPLIEDDVGSKRMRCLLASLPAYRRWEIDLAGFRLAVSDALCAVASDSSPSFEMSVLGGVVRHSTVLACYLAGQACFSRAAALSKACSIYSVDAKGVHLFRVACQFRMYEHGRCPAPSDVTWDDVERTCVYLMGFLESVEAKHTCTV